MDPTDAMVQNVIREAERVGHAAEEILRERIGDRKPTQEELSQTWETAAGADQRAYHRMMQRQPTSTRRTTSPDCRARAECSHHMGVAAVAWLRGR